MTMNEFYSTDYRNVMNESEIRIGEECIAKIKKGDTTFPIESDIVNRVNEISKELSISLSNEQTEAIVKYIMYDLRVSTYVLDPAQPDEKCGAAEILLRQINSYLDEVNEKNKKVDPEMKGGTWEHIRAAYSDMTQYYPLYHEFREDAEMESDYSEVLDDLTEAMITSINEKVLREGKSRVLIDLGAIHYVVRAFENLKEVAFQMVSSYY